MLCNYAKSVIVMALNETLRANFLSKEWALKVLRLDLLRNRKNGSEFYSNLKERERERERFRSVNLKSKMGS